jgi:hypothetical protein
MSTLPTRYELYRGETLLGIVTPTEADFPWHYGRFESSDGFNAVADLFSQELQLLKVSGETKEWDLFYDKVTTGGLRLEPIGGGKSLLHPLIHIDDQKVWWRGGIEKKDIRLNF